MPRAGLASWLAMAMLFLAYGGPLAAQETVLDDFEQLNGWQVISTEGVELELAHDEGHNGMGMRMDFDFHGGAGYVIARKELPVELPPNYAFSFFLRGNAPPNDLEFKLVDPSGKNVWWSRKRDFDFPQQWRKTVIKKRHLRFAWGPADGGDIHNVAAIEIAITAGEGGKGSVWLDDLTLTQREPMHHYALSPLVKASTSADGHAPGKVLDDAADSTWRSGALAEDQWLQLDFQTTRVFGGLVIDWGRDDYGKGYRVQVSDDGKKWRLAKRVRGGNGGRDYIYLPDSESRYLRLELDKSSRQQGYAIHSLTVKPYAFSLSINRFFESIAGASPRGTYPKYFAGEQSYWTVIGARGDDDEALMNEQGMLETDMASYSVEPFLYVDGGLVTWNDVEPTQSLAQGYLPIPSVTWRYQDWRLTITGYAAGEPGRSALYGRYRLENTSGEPRHAKLYLALRPFQVNPPWQDLNKPGGATRIHSIRKQANTIRINDHRSLIALTPASGFGATTFDRGGITEYLQRGGLPEQDSVRDPFAYASGALAYDVELPPGEVKDVYIAAPFHERRPRVLQDKAADSVANVGPQVFAQTVTDWHKLLDRAEIELPPAAHRIPETLKSSIAYALINMDGPAIQPGSRSYERSWIRDGALTSTALLQMGYTAQVRRFIQWFAQFQFASGKIPCCVDHRGADPVPENDSNGAFIYLVMEYYRYTRDVGFLRELWPHVVKAVAYIETLRNQELVTRQDPTLEQQAFHGLMPASISHEGYAADPVHAYWDDFFALRGLKDAAEMARILGEQDKAAHYADLRDAFHEDFYHSLARTIALHNIDYLPGSVELGDFDAPSSAIGIAPIGELGNLPALAVQRTFDKYYDYFSKRRADKLDWGNYSPYESRLIGTFIRLGQPARAHELLDYLLKDQRPAAWNQWAEIVWRDPQAPRYIGDMPHSWVASDFVRAVRSLFVYERESDKALVLAAGVKDEWVTSKKGITVKRLPTPYGTLNYSLKQKTDNAVSMNMTGDVTVPPGRIAIQSPLARPLDKVTVNGEPIQSFTKNHAVIDAFPARVVLHYASE